MHELCGPSNTLSSLKDEDAWPHLPPQVVDGFEVVKAMEAMGSRSGATSYEVVIADCGSLPKGETSRLTE